ncbi:MAG: HAD-IA family hydrolase [Oscillospiraceae bacterium]|nr:HAD-IA family hydrolase [Oscillospiraceae bacterium]
MEKYGILFDLDGTLLDTLEDIRDAINHSLRQCGYPERTLAEARQFVGNGAKRLMEQAVPPGEDPARALAEFQAYYPAHCQIKTRPYDGILPALAAISAKYPIAIVSNKPDIAVQPLCGHYFPGIYARGEHPGCPRKPAPDMVYRTMADIGVEKCIYIGDSEVDVLTAKNAGVPCVSVLWGFRDKADMEAVGGNCFCETPETLTETIEEIIHGK